MRRQELSENDKKSIREVEEYLDHQYYAEEDPFFEEVAEILKNIDNKNKRGYFDEILSEIPENELPDTMDETFETIEDAEKRMDALIAEQEKLDAKFADRYKRDEYDIMRVNTLLTHIKEQVRLLGAWSPAKNMYQKILNNKQLPSYDKVQQLIEVARRIHEKNMEREKGFILKHLTYKSAKIHEGIASLDINSDKIIEANFKLRF